MFKSKTGSKYAFSDPLRFNNMLVVSSGQSYSGGYWIGSGNDREVNGLHSNLVSDIRNDTDVVIRFLSSFLRKLFDKKIFALVLIFFTHNPE